MLPRTACPRHSLAFDKPSPPLPRTPAAADVQQRLQAAGVKGKTLTLKLMRRKQVQLCWAAMLPATSAGHACRPPRRATARGARLGARATPWALLPSTLPTYTPHVCIAYLPM